MVVKKGTFPAHQEGRHGFYWKPSQLPRTSEVIVLRGKPTATTLVYQRDS